MNDVTKKEKIKQNWFPLGETVAGIFSGRVTDFA